jgi:hypothetical protein
MYLAICLYVNQTAYMTIHMFFIYNYTKKLRGVALHFQASNTTTSSVGKFLNNVSCFHRIYDRNAPFT